MKFMYRNIFGSNKHFYSCVAFIFYEPVSTKALSSVFFFYIYWLNNHKNTDI